MSKASLFEALVERIGEDILISTFEAYASGEYVDDDWNAPDPDDADYPGSGTIPGPTYADAVTVKAMIQPLRQKTEREQLFETVQGQYVSATLRCFLPAATEIAHRDQVTIRSKVYWVAALEEWIVDGEFVYRLALLAEALE